MHLEVLVEDSSGKRLLEILIPKIIEQQDEQHTWRIHAYRGVGRIPKGMQSGNARNRILLHQLPRILKGYGRTSGIDAVVVVIDSDNRNCVEFLAELNHVLKNCRPKPANTLFRLAIEEIEAWYLGDRKAIFAAYPKAKANILNTYEQDSVCGTWELLANAVYKGGSSELKESGWMRAGDLKHEWAERIGSQMDVSVNDSPSFLKFRDGLKLLTTK